MKKTILLILTSLVLFAGCKKDGPENVAGEWDTPNIPGALSGIFTVNSLGTKVHFSQGNLYYDGNKFNFEAEQYEFASTWDENHVSHFYWSKTESLAYAHEYKDSLALAVHDTLFTNRADFKVGSAPCIKYRSLSTDEWNYLVTERTASAIGEVKDARYVKAGIKLNDTTCINGVILFPDKFDAPEKFTPKGINNPRTKFGDNQYAMDVWNELEKAGAVFLPAAGHRKTSIASVGEFGLYWSSSPDRLSKGYAYRVLFSGGDFSPSLIQERKSCYSMRLVTEAK